MPERIVEVKFLEWTPVGEIRKGVFVAVREDKDAADFEVRGDRVDRFEVRAQAIRRIASELDFDLGPASIHNQSLEPCDQAFQYVNAFIANRRAVAPCDRTRPTPDCGQCPHCEPHQRTTMQKTHRFARNTKAARGRRTKTMLLPMAQASADELALRVHLALAAMLAGVGSLREAQTLTQTMMLTGFVAAAGYGKVTPEQLVAAEAAISAAFDRGCDTGEWRLDDAAADLFAGIVTIYDEQLRRAPLWAVDEATERLDHFQEDEAHRRIARAQA